MEDRRIREIQLKTEYIITLVIVLILGSLSIIIAQQSADETTVSGETSVVPSILTDKNNIPPKEEKLSFKLNDKGELMGWELYDALRYKKPTTFKLTKNGIRISGDIDSGIFYPLDLKNYVGKKLNFSIWVKTRNDETFIQFTGKEEQEITYATPSQSWQFLSITIDIKPNDTDQKLYIGSMKEGSFEIRDPEWKIF